MNINQTTTSDYEAALLRERELLSVLEIILSTCDLPPDLHQKAQQHYVEKTDHLRRCPHFADLEVTLKPHGSSAIGTVVPPIRAMNGEFDVDLLIVIEASTSSFVPKELHSRVGTYLKKEYEKEVRAIRYGWVLDYAVEDRMHFDVVPAVRSVHETEGKILSIANWRENNWKETNPEGFTSGFLAISKLLPIYDEELVALANRAAAKSAEVKVDPLPGPSPMKSPLQRMVQLAKRHRDLWYFQRDGDGLSRKPASIVLTSILWYAYQRYVIGQRFDSLLSVLTVLADSLRDPRILIQTVEEGVTRFTLPNPSLPTENLVAKWNSANKVPEVKEFFEWVAGFRNFVRQLKIIEGSHNLQAHLSTGLGSNAVQQAFRSRLTAIAPGSPTRSNFHYLPTVGLSSVSQSLGGLPLRNHTFHGKR